MTGLSNLRRLNMQVSIFSLRCLLCFLLYVLCLLHSFPSSSLPSPSFLFSPSHPPSLPLTLSLGCCPQHLRGAVTNCPRKSSHGPRAPPFIFSDSNLLLALLHTCHCVFFLTLEAGGKRSVINGPLRQPATALSSWCDNCALCLSQ